MQHKQKAWRLGAAILKTIPQFKALPDHKKPSARVMKALATALGAAWRRGEGASSALAGDKPANLLPYKKPIARDALFVSPAGRITNYLPQESLAA